MLSQRCLLESRVCVRGRDLTGPADGFQATARVRRRDRAQAVATTPLRRCDDELRDGVPGIVAR